MKRVAAVVAGALALMPWAAASATDFVFRDVAEAAGLFPPLAEIQGHGAGWGDVDGDGWIDLYVGTFAKAGGKPNLFFRNQEGKFRLGEEESLRLPARTTGVVFADLDNDGDLDLYVGSMPQPKNGLAGCALFRNSGGGAFANISKENGACPPAFGGRSVTVLDFDGDGLLDLLAGEDPLPGYNGSTTKSSRLFRNLGGLQFEDVSQAVGLPEVPGLGVAAADVNNDGWPDFFLASSGGGNVLFLNDRGKFREAPGSREVFAWKDAGGDNMICGVCFGDVNRDGLLDLVLGQHFERPWQNPVANRLYLNRGIENGCPKFEDVTDAAGLLPLPMKAPHVEIQDFDNDGWPDILTSIVKFADGKPYPVIFKNNSKEGDAPRFNASALAVNDFPTVEDRAIPRSGEFFQKMLVEKKIIYTAPAPSADFDNDGRIDVFLASWWPEARSMLLRNETPGGDWLDVEVPSANGVNRMGVGARVKIYSAGKLGERSAMLGDREIAVGFGYASGQTAVAHFGLGKETAVDLEVILPHGKGTLRRAGVKAHQRFSVK